MKANYKLKQAIDAFLVRGGCTATEPYTRLLLECIRANDIDQAKRLQTHVQIQSVEPNSTYLQNRLLHLYVKSGKTSDVNNKEEDAWMLFSEMLSENVKPDKYTISSVVSVCARLASLVHGKVIHSKAIRNGIKSDLLVSSVLIDMYSKCGETLDARKVFQVMPIRNLVSWNAMITGYAQNGQDQEALELYQNMLQEKLKPDNITLVGVLSACSRSGSVELGKKYFSSISELHGMKPTLEHYSCMINLLGRPGKMDEAVDLFNSLPEEPNYLISTLLSLHSRDHLSPVQVNNFVKRGQDEATSSRDVQVNFIWEIFQFCHMHGLCRYSTKCTLKLGDKDAFSRWTFTCRSWSAERTIKQTLYGNNLDTKQDAPVYSSQVH
ncbi:hypothetical protein MKW92_046193 [Papaver armeniacum]|nr:hypothetical protein MKW92_046193 [Papaver armeniacum]